MAVKAYGVVSSGAAVGMLLSRNLLMCLQWLMSSDFLLRVALSGWQIIKNFSSRQRLHFLSGLNMIGPFLVFSMLFCSLCSFLS